MPSLKNVHKNLLIRQLYVHRTQLDLRDLFLLWGQNCHPPPFIFNHLQQCRASLKLKKHQECTNKFSWPFHLCTRESTVRGAGRWARGLGLLPCSLMDRQPPVSAVFPWHQMTRLITATATLTKTCQYFMSCQNKGLNCVWIYKVEICWTHNQTFFFFNISAIFKVFFYVELIDSLMLLETELTK